MPLDQSRVYQVTQLRTDGIHYRESAGTGPVVLKVVPVTGDVILQVAMDRLMFFSHTHYWYEVGMLIDGSTYIYIYYFVLDVERFTLFHLFHLQD